MTAIDWEALSSVEAMDRSWHFDFPELSDVYVPGEGDNPRAFLVGEAPGATEEIKRRPFCGQSGQVLRDLMSLSGLHTGFTPHFGESNCWLTNVVKFRPPRNRKPYWIEIQHGRRSLRAEWLAVGSPQVIVPVGGTALQAIVGKPNTSIVRHSGWLHEVTSKDGRPLYVWPMLHPSYGLRNPALRPVMERDWEKLGEWLDATNLRHHSG